MELSFEDRHFLAGQAVYAAIQRGEIKGVDQVEAALMDAHLDASVEDDDS